MSQDARGPQAGDGGAGQGGRRPAGLQGGLTLTQTREQLGELGETTWEEEGGVISDVQYRG